MSADHFIGLISGTSRDGADTAVVRFEDERPDILHACCTPYPEALARALDELLALGRCPAEDELRELDRSLGRFFAHVARQATAEAGLAAGDIVAIGCHGQTVWHDPGAQPPVSLQLGHAGVIAHDTGVTAVTDFRSADLRAGGQGAPLAPLLHRRLFHAPGEQRAVLNLGGIANLTLLAASGEVTGFDTGPANCLLDAWARRHLGQAFDPEGRWAAGGRVDDALLRRCLEERFFQRRAPKSTGLERFNLRWLEARLAGLETSPQDVQATLAELTARTVAAGLEHGPWPERLLICGGGVHNRDLVERITRLLPGVAVESTAHHGVDPDWVEALLFAWLARERILGRTQDLRRITGAAEPVQLGTITRPGPG